MYPDHDMFTAPDFNGVKFNGNRTAIFYHQDFIDHNTGPRHPETPRRLVVMKSAIEAHPTDAIMSCGLNSRAIGATISLMYNANSLSPLCASTGKLTVYPRPSPSPISLR